MSKRLRAAYGSRNISSSLAEFAAMRRASGSLLPPYGAALLSRLSRTTRSCGSSLLLTRYSNSPSRSGNFAVTTYAPPGKFR